MSDFGNMEVFSENLRRFVEISGKTRRAIATDLNIRESTFNCWCRGEFYPRIDNIELLADYFGCNKSDLIERVDNEELKAEAERKALEAINSRTKKKLIEFVTNCSDKEAQMLMSFIKVMKGEN